MMDAGDAASFRESNLRAWRSLQNTLYSDGPRYTCLHEWGYFAMVERTAWSDELRTLINDPDSVISSGHMLKDGDSTTVVAVELGGHPYVIKRYNINNIWYALRRLFRPTRAWYCWRNAHMLQLLDIKTPKPVLMMERRWGPLRRAAYFVTELVEGQEVQQLLSQHTAQSAVWSQVLRLFSELLGQFRDYRIVHGDCKASNFIMAKDGIYVLDLDAMRREPGERRFRKYHERDLRRFKANWQDNKPASELVGELVKKLGYKVKR